MAVLIVDVLDLHGRVVERTRFALGAERSTVTIGRAADADVLVDDPYVAPRHAQLTVTAAGLAAVTDLESVNGVIVDGVRHHAVRDLPLPRGRLQIGRTLLRVRSDAEALAPERTDHREANPRAVRRAVPLMAVCAAISVYHVWLGAPRDLAPAAAMALLGVTLTGSAWVAVWALLSRIVTGEWRAWTHTAIVCGAAAAAFVLAFSADLASFALDATVGPLAGMLLLVCGLALALYLHIMHASNLPAMKALAYAVLVPLTVAGIGYWSYDRFQARDVNAIPDRESLYPPALRLREAGTADAYFAAAAALRSEADQGKEKVDAEGEVAGDE